jgi:hypothetical protein
MRSSQTSFTLAPGTLASSTVAERSTSLVMSRRSGGVVKSPLRTPLRRKSFGPELKYSAGAPQQLKYSAGAPQQLLEAPCKKLNLNEGSEP